MTEEQVAEPVHGETIMWRPGAAARDGAMGRFLDAASSRYGVELPGYRAALAWSVREPAQFWHALWRFYEVVGDVDDDAPAHGSVLAEDRMPGAVWYPGARINYAENILRYASGPAADRPAIVDVQEDGSTTELGWPELAARVAALADGMRGLGVGRGDRVAALLPNVPETIVALLATASIGAIWCVCSPDLSAPAALSRLGQLEAKLLFASPGYRYGGKWFDRREYLDGVVGALPTVEHVVEVGEVPGEPRAGASPFAELSAPKGDGAAPLRFERVPFDHPLWVLFTSGTTGTPKGIVHGHGGMVLEGLKWLGLHCEAGADDRYYVSANTSWMMWNTLCAAMLCGASVVTYSGSPAVPRVDRHFEIVAEQGATVMATGAAYLAAVHAAGLRPGDDHDLSRLRVLTSTGSTMPDATAVWLHEAVGTGFRLADSSGGTDICSAFIGGNPLEPVRLGRMQGAMLGVGMEVVDGAGTPVREQVGELVLTRPMPAMPVEFWNDPDGRRYHAAYFEGVPGVWTHGDWATEGADGTCEILGRSDATLNRNGVRLGSAEIYGALDDIAEVGDALVIGVELPDGGYYLPLFVTLADGAQLDDALTARIAAAIRQQASARHVPDEVVAVPDIPFTHSGKKVELPVKRLFTGADPASIDRGALANPQAMDWFVRRAAEFRAGLERAES